MTTRREAVTFIRFQLHQLRSRNAFHEFEHICRQYARLRIDPSVIPATGPVSAGGDQGRDFESLLKFEGTEERGVRNVFACTLQEDDVSSKVQRDLRAISSGGAVKAVYFFCCTDIAVGMRHKWQEWASSNLLLKLDVIDGQALSEHLADDDLAWIAEEYLGIGRAHLPAVVRPASRYEKLASAWRDSERQIACIDDFLSVRYGIRHTTRPMPEDKSDAVTWLGAMRRFVDKIPTSHALWAGAAYEYIIGTFFLKRHIEGLVPLAEMYLSIGLADAAECGPDQLRDLLTVLNCLAHHSTAAGTGVAENVLGEWRERISSRCATSIEREERPSRRCGFLDVRALLSLFSPSADESTRQDGALAAWREITKIVDEAHFYNVHALAEALAELAPLFERRSEYNEVTSALDSAVATRFGGSAAAGLCFARAKKFCESELLCNAVRELHRAKAEWFSSECLPECVNAFELIANLYMDLGMYLGALYYAQAGLALISGSNNIELVARVSEFVYTIAECRYTLGQSCDYIQTADVALGLPVDRERLELNLVRYMKLLALIDRIEPRLSKAIRKGWNQHPLRASFEANASMAATTVDELLRDGEAVASGIFTDCGPQRRVEWEAYKAHWVITCPNCQEDVEAAEAIGAMLQIMHADMFDKEPWYPVGRVQITVRVQGTGKEINAYEHTERIDVILGRDWWTCTPPELVGGFGQLIALVFLKHDMATVFERSLEDGLVTKLFVGAPYPVLRRMSLLGRRPRLLRSGRLTTAQTHPPTEVSMRLQTDSPRIDGHEGPAWDRAIAARYASWIKKLSPSFRSLRHVPEVMDTVRAWRLQGIPEWHIIGALGSLLITVEFSRLRGKDTISDGPAVASFFESLVDADVDLTNATFQRTDLERSIECYLAAFLASEGVNVNPKFWKSNRYEAFAKERLGFGEPGPEPPDWLGEREA